jgi:hypothetical protein
MNTFVERHRDGTWCVWTTVDSGDRVVSRHQTQAQATIRGDSHRDLDP